MSTRDQPIIPKTSKQQPSSSNQNNSNINLNTSASNAGSTAASTSFSTTKPSSSVTQSTSTTPATTTTTPGTLRTPAKSSFNEASSSGVFQFSTTSTNGQRPSLKQHQEPRTFGEPQQVATYTEREAIKNSPGVFTKLKNFLSTTKKSISSPKASSSKSATAAAEQPGETAQSSPSSNPTTFLWDGNKFVVAEQGLDSGMLFIFKATKFDETENSLPAGSTIEFDSMQFLLRFQNGQHEVITAIAVDTPVNKVSIVTDKVYRGNLANIDQLIYNKEMIYEHPSTDEITYFVQNCKIEPTEPTIPWTSDSTNAISYEKVEELLNKIYNHEMASNGLLKVIATNVETCVARLFQLWPETSQVTDFVQLILITISDVQEENLLLAHEFYQNFLASFISVLNENIYSIFYDETLQTDENMVLMNSFVELLLKAMSITLLEMNDTLLCQIYSITECFTETESENFYDSTTRNNLVQLKIKYNNIIKKKRGETEEIINAQAQNFRELSIIPTSVNLLSASPSSLRPAIIQGGYRSEEEYLTILYTLLQEDFHRPLRQLIECIKIEQHVNIHTVKIEQPIRDLYGGLVVNVTLGHKLCRKNNSFSISNSVILSNDNFEKNFTLASVADLKDARNGILGLKFEDAPNFDTNMKYKLVQSDVFLEAYTHVLESLKEIRIQPIFSNIIVKAETTRNIPAYLDGKILNFRSLMKKESESVMFGVNELQQTLDSSLFLLDESQCEALKYALTSNLAIIQGPPGTGKTYFGLKMLRLLLDNFDVCNSHLQEAPILILAYTNHALDQVLEAMIEFLPKGIVRIGGGSKSELLKSFAINKFRRKEGADATANWRYSKKNVNQAQKKLKFAFEELKKSDPSQNDYIQLFQEKQKLEQECYHALNVKFEEQQNLDAEILKKAKVIGMTTTGAAKYRKALQKAGIRIIVVEEAAQVLEAHTVAPLPETCQHLILIGDHKQLRPNTACHELAVKYHMNISLFERLIRNGYPYRMLKNQHRMRPEISQVLMHHFYADLHDDPSVMERENIKGVTKNLFFVNHHESEEEVSSSYQNIYEANYAIALARYLMKQNYEQNTITILTGYSQQVATIRSKAKAFGNDHKLVIDTIDNYQGEENDIIILSLVRSNNPANKIGFLASPNRVCVALSRAKKGLFIIGNIDFLAANSDLWLNVKRSAQQAGAMGEKLVLKCQLHRKESAINHYNDFNQSGGCDKPCGYRLDCGHACAKTCHVGDFTHDEPCRAKVKTVQLCGHETTTECHSKDVAEYCETSVEIILKCKHKIIKECSAITPACKVEVLKKWPDCGHESETECSKNPEIDPCPFACNMELPNCKHICQGTCGGCLQGRLHIDCGGKCQKGLICGHKCQEKCRKVCPPCTKLAVTCEHQADIKRKCGDAAVKCTESCLNACVHRQCSRLCGEQCNVEPCLLPCQKLLPCDPTIKGDTNIDKEKYVPHQCIGVCGDDCIAICKYCNNDQYQSLMKDISRESNFIQLKGCNHIFEANDINKYISSLVPEEDKTGKKFFIKLQCPSCERPILHSKPFIAYINLRNTEYEQIKPLFAHMDNTEKEKQYTAFRLRAMELFQDNRFEFFGNDHNENELGTIRKILLGQTSSSYLNIGRSWFRCAENVLNIIRSLHDYQDYAEKNVTNSNFEMENFVNLKTLCKEYNIHDFRAVLQVKFGKIISHLDPFRMSDAVLQQLDYEINRFGFLTYTLTMFSNMIKEKIDFKQNECGIASNLLSCLLKQPRMFDDNFKNEMFLLFDQLCGHHPEQRKLQFDYAPGPQRKWFQQRVQGSEKLTYWFET